MSNLVIKSTSKSDAPIILDFIKKLAEYEKLLDEVTATEKDIIKTIFNKRSNVEVILGVVGDKPVAFAVFFHNYSTFLGKKGLYLEDLFVLPEERGNGYGKEMLKFLANLAIERDCGRFEWSVLDWNEPAINFYKSIGAELKNEWVITRLEGEAINKFANIQKRNHGRD